MKRFLFLLVALITLTEANAQDKSFYKGALVISADAGFEAYSINENYNIIGISNKLFSATAKINTTTSAGGSFEFGLFNWLGIGLQSTYNSYNLSKDSSGSKPGATSFAIGGLANIHIIRIQHLDIMLGGNFGLSFLHYTDNIGNVQLATGGSDDLHITARYYFGRFGLNASASLPFTNYPKFSTNSNQSLGENVLDTWKASGGAFSIGIQYRIFSPADL
jgi:hypothetical protein